MKSSTARNVCFRYLVDNEKCIRDITAALQVLLKVPNIIREDESGTYSRMDFGPAFSLELCSDRFLGSTRRFLKKPYMSSLMEVIVTSFANEASDVTTKNNAPQLASPKEFSGWSPTLNSYFSALPKIEPKLRYTLTNQGPYTDTDPFDDEIKEIVAPSRLFRGTELQSFGTNLIDVYAGFFGPSDILLRLSPSRVFAVIVEAKNFDETEIRLIAENFGVKVENLNEYLQLRLPGVKNFDLRLTQLHRTLPYFNEGALIDEDTDEYLVELQSDRVLGGAHDLVEQKYGYAGDCWVEARAIAKRYVLNPSLLLSNRVKGSRSSTLPSIKE